MSTKQIKFRCKGCDTVKTANVPENQIHDQIKLKTIHWCKNCNARTEWIETGYTKIEIE